MMFRRTFLATALLLIASIAWGATGFTPAQFATLRADIAANSTAPFEAFKANPGDNLLAQAVADAYNVPAAPTFKVYKSTVQVAEVMENGFDWTRVDNLSVGKARIWDWMTNANEARTFSPYKTNVRAGINAVWVGTAQDLAVRAVVYTHCVRNATVAEKLMRNQAAGGDGSAPAADGSGPATMVVEGQLTASDVQAAWFSQ